MKKFICIITLLVALSVVTCCNLTGCSEASSVNHNLSKEADEFRVYRRLTVTNARTDVIMLQIEGYMSISTDSDGDLVATIKTGDNRYYKDYVHLNDWTCYITEQLEPTSADKYHYEIVFYPSQIIPDIDIE